MRRSTSWHDYSVISSSPPPTPDADLRDVAGIDPAELAVCLRVLDEVTELAVDHPDAVAIRRATAKVFKSVKQQRRASLRAAVALVSAHTAMDSDRATAKAPFMSTIFCVTKS